MTPIRHDWKPEQALALLSAPFNDLLFHAQTAHRQFHPANEVQVSTLLSIKTGACPEDCAYCPQSAHHQTGLKAEALMPVEQVLEKAAAAKANGATRFCMGAAWRAPRDRDLAKVAQMVRGVRELGLETCATLGMLTPEQAQTLADAGLEYYNHNLDSSAGFYEKIIHTRDYQDRLDTLDAVRAAGLKTCCGGIVGMGESRQDRADFLVALANLPTHPESVPINMLVQVPGTPLFGTQPLDAFEFVRTVAAARIMMPKSMVRLSAGRETMSEEVQALCFMAGANSIFYGEQLLTTKNPSMDQDRQLFAKLGITAMGTATPAQTVHASITAPAPALAAPA